MHIEIILSNKWMFAIVMHERNVSFFFYFSKDFYFERLKFNKSLQIIFLWHYNWFLHIVGSPSLHSTSNSYFLSTFAKKKILTVAFYLLRRMGNFNWIMDLFLFHSYFNGIGNVNESETAMPAAWSNILFVFREIILLCGVNM